jgi:hypothetical protein
VVGFRIKAPRIVLLVWYRRVHAGFEEMRLAFYAMQVRATNASFTGTENRRGSDRYELLSILSCCRRDHCVPFSQ